jgi:hypothetical protein
MSQSNLLPTDLLHLLDRVLLVYQIFGVEIRICEDLGAHRQQIRRSTVLIVNPEDVI